MSIKYLFNAFTGNFDIIKEVPNPMSFQGAINISSDFPTTSEVKTGWFYYVGTNVTDDDASKTNTGDSFLAGDEIAWSGTGWVEIGSTAIWTDDGTKVYPVNSRDLEVQGTGTFGGASSGQSIIVSGLVVNEDGGNLATDDFRAETVGEADAFVVDASADVVYSMVNVGIGTATPNSSLHVDGSVANAYVEKTATYTITSSDYQINCTTNTFTLTLPTAVGITGRNYSIKNTGTGTITLEGSGAETIDGELNQTVNQWDNIKIMSTGAAWIVI